LTKKINFKIGFLDNFVAQISEIFLSFFFLF